MLTDYITRGGANRSGEYGDRLHLGDAGFAEVLKKDEIEEILNTSKRHRLNPVRRAQVDHSGAVSGDQKQIAVQLPNAVKILINCKIR